MKRKFWTVLLAFAAILCLCFALASCGGKGSGGNSNTEQGGGSEEEPAEPLPHDHVYGADNLCTVCGDKWEYTEGLEFTPSADGQSYLVSGAGTAQGDIVIPFGYQGKFVTGIADSAFANGTLTGIELPSSVTFIGKNAFFGSHLTYVTIPATVTVIGDSAFGGCVLLITVNIADLAAWCNIQFANGTANPLSQAQHLVVGGEEVTELVIPRGVTKVSDYAFYGCDFLESIVIPDSVTVLGTLVFGDFTVTIVIRFEGTVEQWQELIEGLLLWESGQGNPVDCENGSIDKNGTVTPTPGGQGGEGGGQGGEDTPGGGQGGEDEQPEISAFEWFVGTGTPEEVGDAALGSYYFDAASGEIYILEDDGEGAKWTLLTNEAGHIHAFTEWETVLDATCTADGREESVCECGQRIERILKATGHRIYSVSRREPTCTQKGTEAYFECSVCEKTFADQYGEQEVDPVTLEIDMVDHTRVYASDFSGHWYKCSKCDYTEEKNPHDGYPCSVCNYRPPEPSVFNFDIQSNGSYAYIERISSSSGIGEAITLPDTDFYGNPIIGINDSVFAAWNCSELKVVIIPDSYTEIGGNAFRGQTSLEYISLPEHPISIGENAFTETGYALDRANWDGEYLYIGDHLVATELSGETLTVRDGTLSVTKGIVNDSVKRLILPSSLQAIRVDGKISFDYAKASPEVLRQMPDVTIKQIEIIGAQRFSSDSLSQTTWQKLESLILSEEITTIGASAFTYAESLTELTLPFVGATADVASGTEESLFGYICGGYRANRNGIAFAYARQLIKDTGRYFEGYIPLTLKSVTVLGGTIGYGAFANCTPITSVSLGDEITELGEYAFNGATALAQIEGLDHIEKVGKGVFTGTEFLATLATPEPLYIGDILLRVPVAYSGELNVKEGTIYIDESACIDCTALTSAVLPDGLEEIGARAFSGATSLGSVTFGEGLLSIGNSAFEKTAISVFTVPETVTTLGSKILSDCSALTELHYNALSASGTQAFGGCGDFNTGYKLIIGAQLKFVPGSIFGNYGYAARSYLSSVEFEAGSLCKSISAFAFKGCGMLKTMSSLPDTVTAIGQEAFRGTSIGGTLDLSHVTSLNSGVFAYTDIENVILSESLEKIYYQLFYGCSSLQTVLIPDSVVSIGQEAFGDCTTLTEVTIGAGVVDISAGAFVGCSNLSKAYFKVPQTWKYYWNKGFGAGWMEIYDLDNPEKAANYLRNQTEDSWTRS